MVEEIWKDVVGFEGLYRVSSMGRVKSTQVRTCFGKRFQCEPRILKQMRRKSKKASKHYLYVNLCKGGKTYQKSVHSIVLTAFYGPKPDGMDARHFPDSNTSNNRIANLSWSTPEDNQYDRVLDGTHNRGENSGRAKLTESDVIEIRAMHKEGHNYSQLGRRFQVDPSSIRAIILGVNWGYLK